MKSLVHNIIIILVFTSQLAFTQTLHNNHTKNDTLQKVTASNTSISVPNISGKWGKTVTLQANLHTRVFLGIGSVPVPGKNFLFYVRGNYAGSATTNNNGDATLNYSIPNNFESGNYDISVSFTGDNSYNSSSGNANLNVLKHTTTLNAPTIVSSSGSQITLETRLTDDDQNGQGISGETISFYQSPNIFSDGTFLASTLTDNSGTARVTFTITSKIVSANKLKLNAVVKEMDHGKKVISIQILKDKNGKKKILSTLTIRVKFNGDGFYESSQRDGTIPVPTPTNINVTSVIGKWGKTVQLKANLATKTFLGVGSQQLSGKSLHFNIRGHSVDGMTNSNGDAIVNFNIPSDFNSSNSPYTISVSFNGDNNYTQSTGSNNLNVQNHETTVTVPNNMTGYSGGKVTLSATLTDNDNNSVGISGKTIKFYKNPGFLVGDGTYLGSGITDNTGKASYPFDVPQSNTTVTETIRARFISDNQYNGSSGDGKLTILPSSPPTLSVTPTDIDLGTNPANTTFTRTFTLKNTGSGTLSGNISKSVNWITSVSPSTFSLNKSQSQTITINGYFPQSSTNFTTNVSVTSNGGNQNVIIHGTPASQLSVTPTQLNLGTHMEGTSFTETFTVKNTGFGTLSGNISKSVNWITSVNPSTFSLTNNKTQTITINGYFPSSSPSPGSIFIYVSSNGGNQNISVDAITNINDLDYTNIKPEEYNLLDNFPNPFNPSTIIEFLLPNESMTSLKVYDVTGKEVGILVNNNILPTGRFRYNFNANNLPSGIYFYKLDAQSKVSDKHFSKVGKMMLLK